MRRPSLPVWRPSLPIWRPSLPSYRPPLPAAAAACFLIGLGLVLLIDAGIARIIGVPLAFIGIALGVTAIASPEFLERDAQD